MAEKITLTTPLARQVLAGLNISLAELLLVGINMRVAHNVDSQTGEPSRRDAGSYIVATYVAKHGQIIEVRTKVDAAARTRINQLSGALFTATGKSLEKHVMEDTLALSTNEGEPLAGTIGGTPE